MRAEPAPTGSRQPGKEAATWARYCDNVARHLIGISRDLQLHVMHCLGKDCGFADLRPSFGPFFALIAGEGLAPTDLAGQLGISNQACSQLANSAQAAGYLDRRPHPGDGRSRLLVLTARGRALVEQGMRIIAERDAAYASLVGSGTYRRFVASLAALHRGLGIPADALAQAGAGSIGVLPLVAMHIGRDLMQATTARGHTGLKMSHGQVLPLIGPEGARIGDLARIQRVSRQAISATSRELEDLGYLRREGDAQDRRGVRLRLTERGRSLVADWVTALDGLERSFLEILGEGRLDHLRRAARALYRALHLEEEIFEGDRPAAPAHAGNRRPRAGERDIRRLATSLRQQLGGPGAARLAEFLNPRSRRRTT